MDTEAGTEPAAPDRAASCTDAWPGGAASCNSACRRPMRNMELAADFFHSHRHLHRKEKHMDSISSQQTAFSHLPALKGADRVSENTVAVYCQKNGKYKGEPIKVSDSVIEMCQQAEKLLNKADDYIKVSANQFSHIYESRGASWLGHRRIRDQTAKSFLKDPSSVLTRAYKNQGMACQELATLMLALAAKDMPEVPKGIANVRLGGHLGVHEMAYLGDHRQGDVVFVDKHARHPIPHLSSNSKFREGVTFENRIARFDGGTLVSTELLNKYAAQNGHPLIDMEDPGNRTLVKAIFLDEAKRMQNAEKRAIFEQNFSLEFPDTTYVSDSHPEGIAFNRMPVATYEHRQRMQDETAAFIASDPELASLQFTTDGIDVPNKFGYA
jgi:hypothetical protein